MSAKRVRENGGDDPFRGAKSDPLKPDAELDYYFASYSNTSIHYDMLSDRVRTESYAKAITLALFGGKRVLDLGCGTAILSMFAARAGAARVTAVEMASIHKQAREILRDNRLAPTVEVLNGKLEDLALPPNSFDVIVSEWMGYLLLYESMFDSVIVARDRYLAPGGRLFPNVAKMFAAAYYDDYYLRAGEQLENYLGVDLRALADYANIAPRVAHLDAANVLSDVAQIAAFDLERCSKDDLDFESEFTLVAARQGFVNGLVVWFDVEFTYGSPTVVLSTSPWLERTHWKQTCFGLDEKVPVFVGDAIECKIWLRRNKKNFRFIDVKLLLSVSNSLGAHKRKQFYLFQ